MDKRIFEINGERFIVDNDVTSMLEVIRPFVGSECVKELEDCMADYAYYNEINEEDNEEAEYWRGELVDTMNTLQEILFSDSRIKRDKLENLWRHLNKIL